MKISPFCIYSWPWLSLVTSPLHHSPTWISLLTPLAPPTRHPHPPLHLLPALTIPQQNPLGSLAPRPTRPQDGSIWTSTTSRGSYRQRLSKMGACPGTMAMMMMVCLLVFMPPNRRCRRHYVFGLSVRPDVRPDFFVYVITQVLLDGISSNLVRRSSWMWQLTDLDFWSEIRPTSRVKGQWIWSKYAIFTSFTRNLKNPWVDFHQTWYRGAPPGVDELIRFWARSVQRQGKKVNEIGLNMLFSPRLREISKTPGWIFIKLGTGVHHWEYISCLFSPVQQSRYSLRSRTDPHLLKIPYINLKKGEQNISFFCPTLWNSLPLDVRSCPSVESFKRNLKTYLYSV